MIVILHGIIPSKKLFLVGKIAKIQLQPTVHQDLFCSECHTDEDKPVCGSDGNNYRNKCELDLEVCTRKINVEIAHSGPCDQGNNAF